MRWIFVVVGLALVVPASVSRPQNPPVRPATLSIDDSFRFLGTSSCSARACHGGLEPAGKPEDTRVLRDEYPKWLLRDRHAQAYQVLLEEPSLRIARHLAGEGAVLPPHKDARCLACHTASTTYHDPTELRLGVSCEACHGPASGWLAEHTTGEWRKLTSQQKQKKGMIATSDVNARAQACAECHVGAPGKDVNHDLIAAGHPRLNFEFSSFMANLPPHWNTSAKAQAAEVWAIGQAASAEAALKLLEFRADAKNKRPWPEFAEYDCFACHHDLETPSWRQKGDANRKPGTAPWGTWYFSMPSLLADGKSLAELKRELEKPSPRRDLPIKPVFDQLQEIAKMDPKKLTQLIASPVGEQSWDVAEQLFLAACAMPESQRRPAMRKGMAELSRYRVLPPEWGSPKNFSPRFFQDFRKMLHEQK